jgi:hypothetical protein
MRFSDGPKPEGWKLTSAPWMFPGADTRAILSLAARENYQIIRRSFGETPTRVRFRGSQASDLIQNYGWTQQMGEGEDVQRRD